MQQAAVAGCCIACLQFHTSKHAPAQHHNNNPAATWEASALMLLITFGWHTAPSAYCLGLAYRDKAEQQDNQSVQAMNKGLTATSHAVCIIIIR